MSNNSVVTVDGGEIGRAQAHAGPRRRAWRPACGSTRSCSSRAATGPRNSWYAAVRSARSARATTSSTATGWPESWPRNWLACEPNSTSCCVRVPDPRPRSTCAQRIWPTWGWPARRTCRSWWSATSTAAACWRTCSAPSRCFRREDQALIAGFVVNKFRGDPALLAPGLEQLAGAHRPADLRGAALQRRVVARRRGLGVGGGRRRGRRAGRRRAATQWLRVAAVRLPRISNSTDVEALACEPGVAVRWAAEPAQLADADVVVIPGSKATVADLRWLRDRGLADAIVAHAGRGGVVLGICGGLQMLCRRIDDADRERPQRRRGTRPARRRHRVRQPRRCCAAGSPPPEGWTVTRSTTDGCGAAPRTPGSAVGGQVEGYRRGQVFGTHWHGLTGQRRFPSRVAAAGGAGCRPDRLPGGRGCQRGGPS